MATTILWPFYYSSFISFRSRHTSDTRLQAFQGEEEETMKEICIKTVQDQKCSKTVTVERRHHDQREVSPLLHAQNVRYNKIFVELLQAAAANLSRKW